MKKVIVYDIEIVKAILGKNEVKEPDIEYCNGWNDHENMGISVIGTYQSWDGRYRSFFEDNKDEFFKSIEEADLLVGFNNIAFDNAVIRACWGDIDDSKCYDLLVEIWAAAGLGPKFVYATHAGYGLDAMACTNLGVRKSGFGGNAPKWFQRGEYGKLVDYNLNDVVLTRRLFTLAATGNPLTSPVGGHKKLLLRKPELE